MSTRRALRLFDLAKEKVDTFVDHFRTSSGNKKTTVIVRGKVRKHSCTFKIKFVSKNNHTFCKLSFKIQKMGDVKRFEKMLGGLVIGFS